MDSDDADDHMAEPDGEPEANELLTFAYITWKPTIEVTPGNSRRKNMWGNIVYIYIIAIYLYNCFIYIIYIYYYI